MIIDAGEIYRQADFKPKAQDKTLNPNNLTVFEIDVFTSQFKSENSGRR